MTEINESTSKWTFLSNHSHVLLCLAQRPKSRVRDLATQVGITERAVLRILADLHEGGYIEKTREGRLNTYILKLEMSLRHPVERHCKMVDLIGLVEGSAQENS
ncbi:MAG: winged helix-turn-helix transcriptional regulator [Lentisphaeraceae bacterium]|nr:winged helix-turn-helix transcriptional regulator [Lentisphaeraceae bacterium]